MSGRIVLTNIVEYGLQLAVPASAIGDVMTEEAEQGIQQVDPRSA